LLQVPVTDLDEGMASGTAAHGGPGTSRGGVGTGAQEATALGSSAVIDLASSDDDDGADGAGRSGRGGDHTHTQLHI